MLMLPHIQSAIFDYEKVVREMLSDHTVTLVLEGHFLQMYTVAILAFHSVKYHSMYHPYLHFIDFSDFLVS